MKVNIQSKKIRLTNILKTHINKRLEKINNHHKNIKTINITLYIENKLFKKSESEITLLDKKEKIFASSLSENIYLSIDNLFEKLDKQILKSKNTVSIK
ncbi:MAG: ribosome-associated translation inhibitor RaiA [Enterobacteriaceae bacterium]|nr:ribosome-associated translation inhibitor RaiA [Enterobacteriaceae bacterium]